jgi:hypothetical protein
VYAFLIEHRCQLVSDIPHQRIAKIRVDIGRDYQTLLGDEHPVTVDPCSGPMAERTPAERSSDKIQRVLRHFLYHVVR